MHYENYKTILSPKNGINIYRGCTHGCIYCDSRSTCYQIRHQFEDIEVKKNTIEILETQLIKKRKKTMVVTGAMSDPYIPLEGELELTRKTLQLIEKYGFGVSMLTKSNLILRDLDILKAINKKTKCVVQMTLTTYDEELCKKLEPNVATTKERVEVLKVMRDEGIPTIVWMSPILPYINDSLENLNGLLDYCEETEVKGILNFGFGTTIRDGSREYFYSQLDTLFPGVKDKYIKTFGNDYMCNSLNYRELSRVFEERCKVNNFIYKPDEIFAYIRHFESREKQLSIFE